MVGEGGSSDKDTRLECKEFHNLNWDDLSCPLPAVGCH